MISLYSGTPGSGKSLHASRDIIRWCKRGKGVICNFPVTMEKVKKAKTTPLYLDNSELTVKALVEYARKNHKVGKEGQTLVVIDECQVKFNSRDFNKKDRMDWVVFFTQHRKYGFDFILIAQYDRMIDKQIRCLIENEYKHRKLNNYGFGGGVLTLLTLGRSWFIAIEYWYGGNKLKLSEEVFAYRKVYGTIYDTFALFSDEGKQLQTISGKKDTLPSVEKDSTNGREENKRIEEAKRKKFEEQLAKLSPSFLSP